MMQYIVQNDTTLVEFIMQTSAISRSQAKRMIDMRTIFVNNRRVWIAGYELKIGDTVELPEDASLSKGLPHIPILYEHNDIIVVNKPAGIISDDAKNSVETILRTIYGESIQAVHRLDKETTGALLFARSPQIFEKYKTWWREGLTKKIYVALCLHTARFKDKTVTLRVDNKPAKSIIHVKAVSENASFVEINAVTGRKHQLRIHCSSLGIPIAGDKFYTLETLTDTIVKLIPRQMLHCAELTVPRPDAAGDITFTAPIPSDFIKTARKLGISIHS